MNIRDAWIMECVSCALFNEKACDLRHIVIHNWDWFSRSRRSYVESVGWDWTATAGRTAYMQPQLLPAKYAKGFKPHGERRRRHSTNNKRTGTMLEAAGQKRNSDQRKSCNDDVADV